MNIKRLSRQNIVNGLNSSLMRNRNKPNFLTNCITIAHNLLRYFFITSWHDKLRIFFKLTCQSLYLCCLFFGDRHILKIIKYINSFLFRDKSPLQLPKKLPQNITKRHSIQSLLNHATRLTNSMTNLLSSSGISGNIMRYNHIILTKHQNKKLKTLKI